MSGWRLLVDIGGTNARFARTGPAGEVSARRSYAVADFADFEAALRVYTDDTGTLESCAAVAVGAAGPVLDGEVRLTNAPWHLSEARLSQLAGHVPVRLVNDLEAVALGLPHLVDADVRPIGAPHTLPSGNRRMLALNVGTGFGAAAIAHSDAGGFVSPSEAGHMSLGAQSEAELALLAEGEAAFTVEDVLSGPGLVRLYRKQCERLGSEVTASTARDVFARVPADAAAKEALRLFTSWLGRVAGDLTLATAAWGGVFLTGGVVHGWRDHASSGLFRASFEAKGKMRTRMSRTVSAVIARDDVALLGLARAAIGQGL